jgi:glucuronokinase
MCHPCHHPAPCRQLFGDEVLGSTNLQMIETARSVGAAAKFTGSGGAIIAYCPGGDEQVAALQGGWRSSSLSCPPV